MHNYLYIKLVLFDERTKQLISLIVAPASLFSILDPLAELEFDESKLSTGFTA